MILSNEQVGPILKVKDMCWEDGRITAVLSAGIPNGFSHSSHGGHRKVPSRDSSAVKSNDWFEPTLDVKPLTDSSVGVPRFSRTFWGVGACNRFLGTPTND